MRSHAKAPTAGSTQRQAKTLGRTRLAKAAVLAAAIASLLAFAATPASAASTRPYESSFGAFSGEDPQALAVDRSNGDIYVVSTSDNTVARFNSSGAAKNFTAGPSAGTNQLSGFNFDPGPSAAEVAIDNSGGSADGDVYVTDSLSGTVRIFASDGTELGALNGSGNPAGLFSEPCGVAVDQSNGDVYVGDYEHRVWRYSPSGATVVEGDYSGGIATSINPCQIAVASGSLYAANWKNKGPLHMYATAEFATGAPPSPGSTVIDAKATAVATDPSTGDVYVDEGDKISVFDSGGAPRYSFGSSSDFGSSSAGVAVTGEDNAYVADPSGHQVDVYGPVPEASGRVKQSAFGSFSGESPQALTVDQSNGDVYALDTAENRLLRFSSTGAPENFSAGPNPGTNEISGLNLQDFPSFDQVAVDSSSGPSGGNIYVTESGSGQVKVFASSGNPLGTLNGSETPAGGLGEDCGVAVDQSNGDVYVASWGNRIWRYSPTGAAVVEGDYSGGIATAFNPCQMAVVSGSLYAHNWQESPKVGVGPVRKFATSDFIDGTPPPPPSSPPSTLLTDKATAVATDPSNGDVYVDEGNQISVFSSAGGSLYSFGSGDFGTSSTGVAIKAGGNVYVSDHVANKIDVYGLFFVPPLRETRPATGIKHTKATLHGHLDPNGSPITGCEFEWGADAGYGEAPIPCTEGSSFTGPADVSAELTGLTPGTIYHFRLHVTTDDGDFNGKDRSFEAVPPSSVPEVTGERGTILSSSSSQLKGSVNPNANPLTDCHFEYVNDLAFQATGFSDLSSGGSVPCDQAPGSIPTDFEDHEVTATVTGLDPEQIYRFRLITENANGAGNGADALVPGPPMVETTGSTYRTATTARFDSRVGPHGAATDYHFEYVTDAQFQASGFADAEVTADMPLTFNEVQRIVVTERHLGSPGQQFKLSFGGYTTPELSREATAEQVQAALRALPSIGSPNVSVIGGFNRFSREAQGVYMITFQGALADTDVEQLGASNGTNPPGLISVQTLTPGGLGDHVSLVSAAVANLQPATTYRYRVAADNGTPGGPAFGGAMTLTTRASDAPLGHGHLAGPPGSDRAWEQVNTPDTGGNGVLASLGFSDNGDRALYTLYGGSPGSQVGSIQNQLFAERTASGWNSRPIHPTRTEAPGNQWTIPAGPSDLSQLYAVNKDVTQVGTTDVWRLSPDAPAKRVFAASHEEFEEGFTLVSDDGSRLISLLKGSLDPDHPDTSSENNFYDVSSGTPHLVSLLPDGSVPSCGVENPVERYRLQHMVSADGSYLFFVSAGSGPCGAPQLYVRDLETETTAQISSGPSSNHARLIRSTADAAFFTTESSIVPEDKGGQDVYRYDLGDENLDCLTCFPGLSADVFSNEGNGVGVSADGSRVYFASPHRLLPGAAGPGIYRLDVATNDLAYVAPGNTAGYLPRNGAEVSPDGSVFVFRSDLPEFGSVNGPQNGGTAQYYRYDDRDRSLVCVSCPADGSPPLGDVQRFPVGGAGGEVGPNRSTLSDDGDLAFVTPTALVPSDQNTARPDGDPEVGSDIYEWRDGRLLLVTDGLTASQGRFATPEVVSVTPSGHDIFFTQFAQLTPDTIEANIRLYDARIGGGFEFPTPPPPCPLEACQGTPQGVPEESRPGSADYAGAGNVASHPARCRKGKVRRRGRCVTKHQKKRAKRAQRRANHDRRASR